ncbi:hypothetical protein LCGC14_1859860 [marine sediment metagenome]|uniref:Uncharacterized protein n=1 Tax=marine sediment metagenome TaxID=412755 RepID=A0A0F9G7Q4_9ZZZZ
MPEITRQDIELWISTVATGEFHYKDIKGLRSVLTPELDNKLRKIVFDICHATTPKCESIGRKDGWYRPIEDGIKPIDFTELRPRDFSIVLPFELRKYVFIYPDTTIIYAGSKSSGKSGLIYCTIKLNWGKINIKLLSNMEGGREQMYDRFKAMGIDLAAVPKFIYPVDNHFHDYINDKDTLYLIDYIDAPEGDDFYLIGAQVKKIDSKLQGLNSVAVIGLQKPMGRDTAFGGEQTLKTASLYLALNANHLKIVDAKVPADKTVHPKNMQWAFHYDDEGTTFTDIKLFHDGIE